MSLESHYSNLIFVTLSSTSCACTFSATPIHYHTPPPFPANRHRHCSGPLVSDWPVLDELHKERRQQHSKVVRLRAAWSSGLCLPAPYTACDTGTAASKQEVSSGGTSLLLLAYHLHVYAVAEKVRLARSRSHHSSIAFWNSHTTVVSCTWKMHYCRPRGGGVRAVCSSVSLSSLQGTKASEERLGWAKLQGWLAGPARRFFIGKLKVSFGDWRTRCVVSCFSVGDRYFNCLLIVFHLLRSVCHDTRVWVQLYVHALFFSHTNLQAVCGCLGVLGHCPVGHRE